MHATDQIGYTDTVRVEMVALLVGGSLLAGCTPASADAALKAAADFQATVAARDWTHACTLLSDEARARLESAAASACATALPRLRLTGDPAGEIQVWGHGARVQVGAGAVFLARYPDGWRIIAAGCEPRGEDRPYDCAVRG